MVDERKLTTQDPKDDEKLISKIRSSQKNNDMIRSNWNYKNTKF